MGRLRHRKGDWAAWQVRRLRVGRPHGAQRVADVLRLGDDQAVVLHVRDRGLVVVTGCGHAGIINIVRHARARARDLRDVFGWSRPFQECDLPSSMLALLDEAPAANGRTAASRDVR